MERETEVSDPVNPQLQAALQYAANGWAVFPCHGVDKDGKCTCGKADCKSPGKHPRTLNGRNDCTTDERIIRRWWKDRPRSNVGIATGRESGVAVLDIDAGRGGLKNFSELCERANDNRFVTLLVSRTGGGGEHHFFAHRDGVKSGANVLAEGIDVRAEGGYVIAPPSGHISGKRYRWLNGEEFPSADAAIDLPPFPPFEPAPRKRPKQAAEGATIAEGGRNDALMREAGRFRKAGMIEAQINERLQEINRRRCSPPLDVDEVARIAASAATYPAVGGPGDRPLTDAGNAEKMADLFGARLRYNHRQGHWLVWRQHFWEVDTDREVDRLAVEAARQRQREAVDIPGDAGKKVFNWGKLSESRSRIDAAVALARSTHPFNDKGDGWDADPLLLACQNGVVNLRTGELRDGRPEDRITLAVPHDYDPAAQCPRWHRFLEEIIPDWAPRRFLARAIGYCLTGLTREQCWFLLSGTGSNGKTTLLKTLAKVWGPLAMNMPFSTFTAKWGGHQQTNDLAAMPGKRLVMASETGETSTLDEARVKALSGEDTISARFLYHELFEFKPVCKLVLSVNHRPIVKDDTYAFWRRVHCIDFPRSFKNEDIDKGLTEALAAESRGILAWCVRLASGYIRAGLRVPECVQAATRVYQEESDPLADFFAEEVVTGERLSVSFQKLYNAYLEWVERRHIQKQDVVTRTALGRRLGQSYTKLPRQHGIVRYRGLDLAKTQARQ